MAKRAIKSFLRLNFGIFFAAEPEISVLRGIKN